MSFAGELQPDENVYVEMPLGFSQYSKDGTKKVSNWIRPFTDFDKALELSGKKLPKSSTPVHWHNLDSIPASLLEPKLSVLSMLMT